MTWNDPAGISRNGLDDELVLKIDTSPLGESFAFSATVSKDVPKQLSKEQEEKLEVLDEQVESAQTAI